MVGTLEQEIITTDNSLVESEKELSEQIGQDLEQELQTAEAPEPVLVTQKESDKIEKTYPGAQTPKSKPKAKSEIDPLKLESLISQNSPLVVEAPKGVFAANTIDGFVVRDTKALDNIGNYLATSIFDKFNLELWLIIKNKSSLAQTQGLNRWSSLDIRLAGERDLKNVINSRIAEKAKVNKSKINVTFKFFYTNDGPSSASSVNKRTKNWVLNVALPNGNINLSK